MTLDGLKREGRNLVAIVLGITVYALGFCIFILPHGIVIGGIAGFSTLVYYATRCLIPIAVIMYGTNILLLLSGLKVLGKSFLMRTIFGATLLSMEIGFMEGYFSTHNPIIASTPMSVVMGAVVMGIGISLYYSHHGTAGGTDIVAAIMAKKSNVSVGRVMMIVDVSIVALSFFLPFDGDTEARIQSRAQTIIFGWLAIVIYSWIVDKYLGEGRQTVQFVVISDKWEEIAYRITHETGRGVTLWEGRGYWTGQTRVMMMIWCRKYDTYAMLNIIDTIDRNAYVTASYVRGIYGNGFDALHAKIKRHR